MLEGLISGSAPFEMSYVKDSKQIRSDRRHIMSLKNDIATLQILKFDGSDVGKYQCTVANDVGKSSCDFQIYLKGWLARKNMFFISACALQCVDGMMSLME